MKTTTAQFLAEQIKPAVEQEFRVELFQQWSGDITDRDSAIQIKVSGDATALLANGDMFIIPLDNFETEHVITTAPSYNAGTGKTTLICSASSFPTTVVGLGVALKIDISAYVLDEGFSPIRISTEGDTLNEFLADDVTVKVDNSDNYFYDPSGSGGLFNNDVIFWLKIIFKLKNNSTEFLCFGGVVFRDDIKPINESRDLEFTALGHLKELERYPGFALTETAGMLPHAPGITLFSVSGASYEDVRKIKYTFPNGEAIKDLAIKALSSDSPVGWHVVKFRPPDEFQYDFGAWAAKVAGTADETLTAAKGHILTFDVPESFDIEPHEDWFYLASRTNLTVAEKGKMSLQFSEGPEVDLLPSIDVALFYDASAGTYTDITEEINTADSDEATAWNAINDEVIIMTREQISGLYLDINSDFIGEIYLYYGANYNNFVNMSCFDNTYDLIQSGPIYWTTIPAQWKRCDHLFGAVLYQNYYTLKIKVMAYTSGSANLRRILKQIRLIGSDGVELTARLKFEHLPRQNQEDDVILAEDSGGALQPAVWRENYTYYHFLNDLLDVCHFKTGKAVLTGGDYITNTTPFVGFLGKPPKHFYNKKPTALCYGEANPFGGVPIYLGIEDELWKYTEEGGFTFLDKLDPYIRAADGKYFKLEIRRLILDGNNYIQGLAWKDYFDQGDGADYSSDVDYGRNTPAVVFRSTDRATITEQNKIDSADNSIFNTQEVFFRDGTQNGTDQYIGQVAGVSGFGENVVLPFDQFLWHLFPFTAYFRNNSTLNNTGSAADVAGIPALKTPGFYNFHGTGVGAADPFGLCFSFNQNGFVFWDENLDKWIFIKWNGGLSYKMAAVNYAGIVTDLYDTTDYNNQFPAGCYYNQQFYFARMVWDDSGGTFPGDYSDCTLEKINNTGLLNVVLFNFASDSVEANQSLASGNEKYCTILDMVYNEAQDTIHGCLMDRSNFEYHYFVYTVVSDKLYTSQTGSGFTFNDGRQIKKFLYNPDDEKVYAFVIDARNRTETAFLISAVFTPPVGAPDGSEIDLTFESEIKTGDWDIVNAFVNIYGEIYGLSGPNYNYMFKYHTNFYPHFYLGNMGDSSLREIIAKLAEALTAVVSITPARTLYFYARETNIGSMTIDESDHYLQNSMSPVQRWQHYYDGVEVSWENPMTGEKGVEKAGLFGWNRRILKIDNFFIQDQHLAALIAAKYNTFFANLRRLIEFRTIPLWQIDKRDKFTFNYSENNFEFLTTDEWMVDDIEIDHWKHEGEIKGIEKIN